jgi:hypothetical protein
VDLTRSRAGNLSVSNVLTSPSLPNRAEKSPSICINGSTELRFHADNNYLFRLTFLAPPGGFEPPTCDLGNAFQAFAVGRRHPRKYV